MNAGRSRVHCHRNYSASEYDTYAVHLLATGTFTDFEIGQPFCLDASLSSVAKDAIEVFLFFLIIITSISGIVEPSLLGFFSTRIYTKDGTNIRFVFEISHLYKRILLEYFPSFPPPQNRSRAISYCLT